MKSKPSTYKIEGWMDYIEFHHEASDIGGTIYPTAERCRVANPHMEEDDSCRPLRVYITDADEQDDAPKKALKRYRKERQAFIAGLKAKK